MDDNDARTDYFAVIYDCHPAADPIPESINSSLSAGGGGRRRMDALTHQSVHPSFDSSVLCFRFLVVSLKEAHRCIPTLAESFFFFLDGGQLRRNKWSGTLCRTAGAIPSSRGDHRRNANRFAVGSQAMHELSECPPMRHTPR